MFLPDIVIKVSILLDASAEYCPNALYGMRVFKTYILPPSSSLPPLETSDSSQGFQVQARCRNILL